jgi:hypothetical protein
MSNYNAAIELNQAIYEHQVLATSVGRELDELAYSAGMLGLDRMAKSISDIVKALDKSVAELISAHSQSVHDNLVSSEQATTNMMRGILAGITIGSKDAALNELRKPVDEVRE